MEWLWARGAIEDSRTDQLKTLCPSLVSPNNSNTEDSFKMISSKTKNRSKHTNSNNSHLKDKSLNIQMQRAFRPLVATDLEDARTLLSVDRWLTSSSKVGLLKIWREKGIKILNRIKILQQALATPVKISHSSHLYPPKLIPQNI